MNRARTAQSLQAWFARQGWHLGSILPETPMDSWDARPPILGIGYDERGRRSLFPIWVVPEVTPRVLEVVEHFQRRWVDYRSLWPVPVEAVIPIVGALRWSEVLMEDLRVRGIRPLTVADADVWTLMEEVRGR